MRIRRRVLLVSFFLASLAVCLLVWGVAWWYEEQAQCYTCIEDGPYVGGKVAKPPWGTKAVLNLCEQEDSYQTEIHVWEPIPDAEPAPTLDWLRERVRFIDAQQKAGFKTFVHCRNGVSRSGMVVVAYLMFKNEWTRDEALEFVRKKRPEVRPNRAFMERLLDWERVLKGQPVEENPSHPTGHS